MDAETSTSVTSTSGVPQSWPGAFGIFKYSRKAIQLNAWSYVGLGVLYIVVSIVFGSLGGEKSKSAFDIGSLISWLIGTLLSAAISLVFIEGVRGNKLGVRESLGRSLPLYFNYLAVSVLTVLITTVSFLLLIIPYFFVMPRLTLAGYFVVDKKLGPIEALKASWNATKGNVGKVWGIFGATLVMCVLILVLVGIYFVIMYAAASAVLYVYLADGRGLEQTETPPVTPSPQIQQ